MYSTEPTKWSSRSPDSYLKFIIGVFLALVEGPIKLKLGDFVAIVVAADLYGNFHAFEVIVGRNSL